MMIVRAFAIVFLTLPVTAFAETAQPYSGQQERAIASLSDADIAALLAGEGWGFALPAELNGYPGPAHVLEAAEDLELTEDQLRRTQEIFAQMNAQARAHGEQYVRVERHLSDAFRDGTITAEMLAHMTAMAGETRARLRETHLQAHLEMTPVLTDAQRQTYAQLRGYDLDSSEGHDSHSGHDMQH